MTPEVIACIGCLFALLLISIMLFIKYAESVQQRKQEFEIKLQAASTAKNSHILNMGYKDLLSIVDTNMLYYVDQEILVSGISNKESDEEKSIHFNTLLIDVCTRVETSLSKDLKEALYFYVTEEHLRTYIKDSCRVILIAKIEQKATNNKK